MLAGAAQMNRLAARVRWLDRWRRWVSTGFAIAATTILWNYLPSAFSPVSVVLGFALWWLIELSAAYAGAVWETEHAELSRPPGLPRAIVNVRERR